MSTRRSSKTSLVLSALLLLGGCAHGTSAETTANGRGQEMSAEEQSQLALRDAGCTLTADPDEATGSLLQCDAAGVRVRLPMQDWAFVPNRAQADRDSGVLLVGGANQGLYTFSVARVRTPSGQTFDQMADEVFTGMLEPFGEEEDIRVGTPTFEDVGERGDARLMSLPLRVTADDGTPMLGDTFGFVHVRGADLWLFAWSDWGTEASFDAQVHSDNAALIDTIEFRD